MNITFRYLSEPDMIAAGVTDMKTCIDVMQDTFRLMGIGDFRMCGMKNNSHGAWLSFPDEPEFADMPKNGPDRRFMAMPAYLGGRYKAVGMKWYGSNVENKEKGLPRSILLFVLNDPDTGAPKALMSANLLSAVRTGAVPGLGARYFAPVDTRVLCVVGPGVMNRTALDAFMAERPDINTVKIFGRSRSGIDSYRRAIAETYHSITTVVVADSVEDAVRDADIVSVAVTAPESHGTSGYPLIKRSWVKPGAYLSLASAVRIDEALYADDVLKVVDSLGQYEAYAEETPAPHHAYVGLIGTYFVDLIESGELTHADIVDLGTVATERHPGRTKDDQIVILSVGGLPTEDIAWGAHVYERAVRMNIGTELSLWERPELA